MNVSESSGTAWYWHFWPWFLVILMALSITASLFTVSVAYRLGDIEEALDAPRGVVTPGVSGKPTGAASSPSALPSAAATESSRSPASDEGA